MSDTVWISIGIGIGSAIILLLLTVLLVWCYRRRSRYEYTPIGGDVALPTKWNMEKELEEGQKREAALLNCQFFLRANVGKYLYNEYLKQIGSRQERQWFIVRNVQMKKDLLLTVTPKSEHCQILYDSGSNSKSLEKLLTSIKHPYIWPVSDLVLQKDQQIAIVLEPFNSKGSLKDLIHNTRPQASWQAKMINTNKGLATRLIQLYGRQVLEALLYLKENNFPAHRHVHSGNVILQNGVCRLSALDNMFLGYTSSLQQLVHRKIRNNIEAIDVICFGHLMYEMVCGTELDSAHPDSDDYDNCKDLKVKEVLEFIFNKSKNYPSLEEVAGHTFFSTCNLVQLNSNPPQVIKFTSGMKSIIKQVHRSKLPKISTENSEKKPVQRQASKNNVKEPHSSKSKKKTDADGKRRKTSSRATTHPVSEVVTMQPTNNPRSALLADIKEGNKKKVSNRTTAIPPPPPPPVPSIPPPSVPSTPQISVKQPTSGPRVALLSDIRKGMSLKKTKTSDKSAPKI